MNMNAEDQKENMPSEVETGFWVGDSINKSTATHL